MKTRFLSSVVIEWGEGLNAQSIEIGRTDDGKTLFTVQGTGPRATVVMGDEEAAALGRLLQGAASQ